MKSSFTISVDSLRNGSRGRKTVAAFYDYINPFSGGYQAEIRNALNEICDARDVNLLAVFGRSIEEPNPQSSAYNTIYELFDSTNVDGIIVLSTTLGVHCGNEGIARFLQRYRGMPLCSLGFAVNDIPSIEVDNRQGMNSVLEHIFTHHSARRVAFMQGASGSPEAQARYEVYLAALERYGIEFDPELVVCGEFQWTLGNIAMKELLARKVQLDAVVAANDLMAFGALEALRRSGQVGPGGIAVAGFDDLPEASAEDPPLTTVAQPYAAMAQHALDLVLNQIAGRDVPNITKLPPRLIIRESCGCGSRMHRPSDGDSSTPVNAATRSEANRVTAKAAGPLVPAPDGVAHSEPPLREILLNLLGSDGTQLPDLGNLTPFCNLPKAELDLMWSNACERVALDSQRKQLLHRGAADETLRCMMAVGERISGSLDAESLRLALLEVLPATGIKTAYLSRYSNDSYLELEAFVALRGGRRQIPTATRFPTRQLLPPGTYSLEEPHKLLIFPIVFDSERLGVAVFEHTEDSQGYQIIRDQIAAGLRTVALHQSILEQTMQQERRAQEQERLATAKRLQALSVLAGGVAHDLNNALGPLVALPDIMIPVLARLDQNQQATGDLRSDLQSIKAASLHAAQTIKDLLTLSRQGRTTKEPLDLGLLLVRSLSGDALESIQRLNERVQIECRVPPEPVVVRASEPHLVRAINNLVRNAVESIEGPGRVSVRVACAHLQEPRVGFETVEPGQYAVVIVSDSGRGIPEADRSRIFEPFFSQKRLGDQSGSGLGLAIVHSVIKEHEGYVDVASASTGGTTFTLYFPRSEEVVSADVVPSKLPSGKAKILVVDDDSTQRRTCRRVLAHLGYEVDTLGSGQEACERFEQSTSAGASPYDLVILDMVLHQALDGLDVYQRIHECFPAQKAIMVSGYAAVERAEAALRQGLMWVVKPYTAEALARAVQVALSERSSQSIPTLSTAPPLTSERHATDGSTRD